MAVYSRLIVAAAATLISLSSPAYALCSYDGVDYAKTTVSQEFHDSKWVARVRVASANDHLSDTEDGPWISYKLEVLETFKGQPPNPVPFFTYRNSGAFYFDRPWTGPDIGGEYLVFLNPTPTYKGQPRRERGTVFVNYACGQSKPWNEVTDDEQELLKRFSGHKS